MILRKLNPWIFAIGNLIITFQKYFISNSVISGVITSISVLGIIYAVYTSNMSHKAKTSIIALYILFLMIYFIL